MQSIYSAFTHTTVCDVNVNPWLETCTQALQQDLQVHQKRLSDCKPERLDALVSENAVLKRSCDELHVCKEQVEHYRGLWLGSNKKNAELEVGTSLKELCACWYHISPLENGRCTIQPSKGLDSVI